MFTPNETKSYYCMDKNKNRKNERPTDIQADFVRNGKHWRFLTSIKNDQQLAEVQKANWLKKGTKKVHRWYYTCKNYKNPLSGQVDCRFWGFIDRRSSNFYVSGEHSNHGFIQKGLPNGDKDYVDRRGKHWRFISRTSSQEELTTVLKQNWLMKGEKSRSGTKNGNTNNPNPNQHYTCRFIRQKRKFALGGCKLKGIYYTESSALYISGEHNHPLLHREIPQDRQDYFDVFGKNWPFFTRITDHSHLLKVVAENCLKIYRNTQSTIKCTCRRSKLNCAKGKQALYDCPVRATFLKGNSTLYLRGKHTHELIEPKGRKFGRKRGKGENSDGEGQDQQRDEEDVNIEINQKEDKEDSDSEMDEEEPEENEVFTAEEERNNLEENGAEIEEKDSDIQFVEEINHQEYKMLPPMKRECDDFSGSKNWPIISIESEAPGWQWQQTRSEKEALLQPVKKEEPVEEEEEQPSTSNATIKVAPHKMYLRPRTNPINYSER